MIGVRGVTRLKLYISGGSARSDRAIENLRRICEDMLPGSYQIKIIDIRKHPREMEQDGVLATTTLVKESPPPATRIIGDLSCTDRVLSALCLDRETIATR
jgi:circadian clock protein KaiB